MSGGRWPAWRAAYHAVVQVKNVTRSRWILRDCDRVGRFSRLGEGNAVVDNRGTIEIGERTRLMGRFAPVELRTGERGRLTIGDRTLVNYGTTVQAASSVSIGSDVDIGPYCVICDVDVGGLDCPAAEPPRPIVIGSHAWLATRVVVRPGAVIGDGTVVAAGSVVDGVLPPRVVAAGSPARVVRHLDDPAGDGPEQQAGATRR
jgi:maltose O-acetyltransferase